MLNRILALVAIGCVIAVVAIAGGCASNNVDVQIKSAQTADNKGNDGYDPLTRGKVRRQILNDMEENLNIWLKGDAANYKKAFSKRLLPSYKAQLEKLHKSGQDKVRIHANQHTEVTQLQGSEGAVKYTFTDKSYFVFLGTKKIARPATNADNEIDIVVVKEDGRWKIGTMIGGGETTL